MWDKISTILKIMHKSSYNKEQEKLSYRILLAGEILVELFMLILIILELPNYRTKLFISCIIFFFSYLIGIIVSIKTKSSVISSLIFCPLFLVGFSLTFYHATHNTWGAMWMIVIPALSMYILNFSVAFWTCLGYSIVVTFLSFYPPTREVLIARYSEVFISRYFLIYDIDLIVSSIAMYQLHLMSYRQSRTTESLEEAVREEREKVTSVSMETIIAINNAVQAKDLYTGRHSQRVAHFSCLLAEKLGWDRDAVDELRIIALLHDIGKIGVDETILNKPSKLTDEEYIQMKNHTVIGGTILKDLTLIPNVALGAKYHHERYDGKGYPEGLSGKDIPLAARIIGIADTFDAMNFSRVYRPRCDLEYVKSELQKGKGTQFDPDFVEVFIQVCEENEWFRNFE